MRTKETSEKCHLRPRRVNVTGHDRLDMDDLLQTLPPLHRLALAYAPAKAHRATLTLLALDSRLAEVVRNASEPMLAQIRLAWWRDMLGREASDRPQGEPLLELFDVWRGEEPALVALVDGWEELATDEAIDDQAMHAFCSGRGQAFAALARVLGCGNASQAAGRAGEGWSLADLASRLSGSGERDAAIRLVREQGWQRIALPRALRPLAVLYGLGASAGREGSAMPPPSLSTLLLAMRIGLLGR